MLIDDFWNRFTVGKLSRCSAVYAGRGGKWHLLIGDGGGADLNYLLSYDPHPRQPSLLGYSVGSWEVHAITGSLLGLYKDPATREIRVLIASEGGIVNRLFDGGSDLGKLFRWAHQTPWLDFGDAGRDKELDQVDIELGQHSAACHLTATLYVDFTGSASNSTTYAVDAGTGGGFGVFPIQFGPTGGFLRTATPRIGKFRRLSLRIEESLYPYPKEARYGYEESAQVIGIAFWLRSKSVRYRK